MFTFTDRVKSSTRTRTHEGFLRGSAALTRSGLIQYLAKELQLDGDPNRVVTVYRKPEHVFNATTMDSIRGAIVTLEHPPSGVTPDSWSRDSVGSIVGEPRRDGDLLVSDILVGSQKAIDRIENDGWDELSVGYSHDMAPANADSGYDYVTTGPLTINHVAIVERGRAGNRVRIFDRTPEEETEMTGLTADQVQGIVADALTKQTDAQRRQAESEKALKDTVQATVMDTLKTGIPAILKELGIDMAHKKGDAEDEDETDALAAGGKKTRSMNPRHDPRGYGNRTAGDSDILAQRIAAAAGKDVDPKVLSAAMELTHTVMADEMTRIGVMRDVGHMLDDTQKRNLRGASTHEILVAALGDNVPNAKDKPVDYLLAMVDMMKSQSEEFSDYGNPGNQDSQDGNVFNFMPNTGRRNEGRDRNPPVRNGNGNGNDQYRVVGRDMFGDVSNHYDEYGRFLDSAWGDTEEKNGG